jgi:histidinol dehydrogenase
MIQLLTEKSQLLNYVEKRRSAFALDSLLVQEIISAISDKGDEAVREFTKKFDGVDVRELRVSDEILLKAKVQSDSKLQLAVLQAAENIRLFHEKQLPEGFDLTQNDGTKVSFHWRPIERVGVYIPSGNFPLLSTVLMNVIPAQVAEVKEIIVCTPPGKNGSPNPAIIDVCKTLGIKNIFQVGGAQAITAMAFGTESIPHVDKIVGPGNRYVATARQIVSNRVGIDMIAGPTELVIIADKTADPNLIAADLIAQAEHDSDAMTILLSPDKSIIEKTISKTQSLLEQLETKIIAGESLQNNGFSFRGESVDECVDLSNMIAPEHVSLHVAEPEIYQDKLIAGAIFLGSETPVAWGDYWAGPNHTLPTSGAARYKGMLSVFDFLVPYSITQAKDADLLSIDAVTSMAEAEGLAGHALSTKIRKENES